MPIHFHSSDNFDILITDKRHIVFIWSLFDVTYHQRMVPSFFYNSSSTSSWKIWEKLSVVFEANHYSVNFLCKWIISKIFCMYRIFSAIELPYRLIHDELLNVDTGDGLFCTSPEVPKNNNKEHKKAQKWASLPAQNINKFNGFIQTEYWN